MKIEAEENRSHAMVKLLLNMNSKIKLTNYKCQFYPAYVCHFTSQCNSGSMLETSPILARDAMKLLQYLPDMPGNYFNTSHTYLEITAKLARDSKKLLQYLPEMA